ncbi:MAG TPA: hemerythrin domain-containing protein [Nocardioides sp.]|uniref:hemerythrin domain-containing protein n=1 Tax=Nocardioides sp. TaxID=35761 RepID=UPI002E332D9A|nr:hemerythrin domain-containing protein [Nocardioides sp.]HEX5088359.1 hemerythrin domain-containing protein [Nocardioides sp.]
MDPIAQLMDEHFELLDLSTQVRGLLASGDRRAAWAAMGHLSAHLLDHVRREEDGVFRAMREQGEFIDAVVELEAEHLSFDEALSDLDLAGPDLEQRVNALLDDLSVHIDKENLGIFPAAVVTLGATGWGIVEEAHARTPAHAH